MYAKEGHKQSYYNSQIILEKNFILLYNIIGNFANLPTKANLQLSFYVNKCKGIIRKWKD